MNKTIPTQSNISESDKAELEEFLFNAKMLTNTLGHKVFDQIVQDEPSTAKKEKVFIRATRGADACGQPAADGFVVFAGSRAAKEIVASFKTHSYQKLRASLIENVVLSDQGDHLLFENDYVFSTPSAAAAIVMGRSANGLIEWKSAPGQKLKDMEQD